ncbi:flagellar motor protein MotB [Kiloniella antarctica]|uniref:Flagellar motor protein MotB n=1 Tax=Kiloniella antarctica TaxID=1550907 RepID=A0ABW5BQW9_9PROT
MAKKRNKNTNSLGTNETSHNDAKLNNADELYEKNDFDDELDEQKQDVHGDALGNQSYFERLVNRKSKKETIVTVNYGSNWMVTFTDLVALMLTFFVLLYSMSVMEEKKWRNLVTSLSNSLTIEQRILEPKPSKSLTMDPVDFVPGEDLDYLSTLIAEKVKDDPQLSKAILTRLEDRLVISLPGDLLFEPGEIKPRDEAETVLLRLGRVLRFIDNKIEIAGHADPSVQKSEGAFSSNWSLSLARADYVAGLLGKSGYKSTILSRGYGDSRYDKITDRLSETLKNSLARRVDIIVHLYAGENG